MHINWSTFIWIGVVLFVYFFGIWEGRGQGYKRRKAEEEQEKKEQPEAPPQPATITGDDPGLLRIKNDNNGLTLDLDGNRVNPTYLSPDQRKRLIEMINLMRPWLEGRPAAPAMTTTPTSPPVVNQPTPPPAALSPASIPASSARISQPAPSIPAAKNEDKLEAAPTSMVGQINLILQTRIAGTKFMSQGISLMETPSGGVNVYVGLNRYEAIDEIPDEEIKAIIRAAIAEWEKKYTPGLS